jgi:hypothetical protein
MIPAAAWSAIATHARKRRKGVSGGTGRWIPACAGMSGGKGLGVPFAPALAEAGPPVSPSARRRMTGKRIHRRRMTGGETLADDERGGELLHGG